MSIWKTRRQLSEKPKKKNSPGENDGDLKTLVYSSSHSINVWFPGVTLQGLSGSGWKPGEPLFPGPPGLPGGAVEALSGGEQIVAEARLLRDERLFAGGSWKRHLFSFFIATAGASVAPCFFRGCNKMPFQKYLETLSRRPMQLGFNTVRMPGRGEEGSGVCQ